jgi:hypothetical protein
MAAHIGGVDHDLLAVLVGGVERDVVENALHNGEQPAGADILDGGVYLDADIGDGVNRVLGEFEIDTLGLHQRNILLDEAGLGLGEDTAEILARQRAKLDADRKPALKLGQKV